ncbi:metal ABC transporter permease [Martelella alba]|uniref:Metal ABC transporter permease n=1 Tax=Martelella alba TaxID=2590451 RepID=A0ABY2SGV6_9HYPH|nr:metal ABC transporter permease [Martelella alba]TKI03785.1 metal ABC transporter permease [Martelella alba]
MTDWLNLIAEPLALPFMRQALLASVATGLACSALSCFLVLKGWALMGDAISHAVLPGIVLAWLAGLPLGVGAFGAGVFCAAAAGFIKNHCRLKEDTVLGIVYSGMFALGLVLFSRLDTDQHLGHILFGNLLGITAGELRQTLTLAGAVLTIVLVKRRDLMLYCFDPAQTRLQGLSVAWLRYGLLCLLALTVVTALQAVGIILAIAMLITPGVTALTLCRRFDCLLLTAMGGAVFASVAGTLVSYHIDGATGPCIVLMQVALFTLAQIYSAGIGKRRRRAR